MIAEFIIENFFSINTAVRRNFSKQLSLINNQLVTMVIRFFD